MTQREKKLLGILVVLTVVLGGGMVLHFFLFQPLMELWSQNSTDRDELQTKQGELENERRQTKLILDLNPRLQDWEQASLSPPDPKQKPQPGISPEDFKAAHQKNLRVEYERYLSKLMRDSGFEPDSISITARAPERVIGTGAAAKAKEQPFERLMFTAAGRSKLDGVVQMMHDFHRTNRLHEIRNLTVGLANVPTAPSTPSPGRNRGAAPPPSGLLDVNLTIEALMVKDAKVRPGSIASASDGKSRVLAEPARSYSDLTARNMFIGMQPIEKTVEVDAAQNNTLSEERRDVLRFVRLTTLSYNGRRWEAYLYDLAKGGDERRINSFTLDSFSILDQYQNSVLDAKVAAIDERNLVIKADNKYYRLHVGDFFAPAMEKPLTPEELKEFGIKEEEKKEVPVKKEEPVKKETVKQ
jgi:hypothetical protein